MHLPYCRSHYCSTGVDLVNSLYSFTCSGLGGEGGGGGLGPRPWLDTSARCMGLVVGRFHKNVLSEGGGFLSKAFYGFFCGSPPAATMKNLSKNKKIIVICFY